MNPLTALMSEGRDVSHENLLWTEDAEVVNWEEFCDAFNHLGGVAVNLNQLKAKRAALSEKLELSVKDGSKSVQRKDCLEIMKRGLREKQKALDKANTSLRDVSDQLRNTKEKLFPSSQAFLQSAKALAGAQGRLQEADRLLGGEGGHGRLTHLRKLLDARRRQMVGQVASIYPIGTCTPVGLSSNQKQNPQAIANSQLSGPSNAPAPASNDGITISPDSFRGDTLPNSVEEPSLAIAGLQLVIPLKKQPGLYSEKNEFETSASALGYVAHVVSLVASYLDVQLRYPVRLGASRSYIQDYSPAAEPGIVEAGTKLGVEFPLFSDNQDLTRSAYAVFLLNKDLEQILNRLGVESVGPRHTLQNLNRLISVVNSGNVPLG